MMRFHTQVHREEQPMDVALVLQLELLPNLWPSMLKNGGKRGGDVKKKHLSGGD